MICLLWVALGALVTWFVYECPFRRMSAVAVAAYVAFLAASTLRVLP